VVGWEGRLSQSIFRHLLTKRAHRCSRDELLAAFWPDTSPDIARNRLQVAVSSLRRTFRNATDARIIEYEDETYRISSDVHLVVDTERFETAMRSAQTAHRSGDRERALSLYRDAIRTYRGDFAPDALYEEWTLLTRERFRILYLDALDRASHLELAFGLLDACIDTAQRMLDQDPCREDAHRLLMYCYAEQRRPHLVDQQFQFCTRVLRGVLDAHPSPETMRMYLDSRERATQRW
jgi:DNA-binding SARP family transcriptional activator